MTGTKRNPSIRTLESHILREGRAEDIAVKQEAKNLSRLEKELGKARKSIGKADSILAKRERYELKTAGAMNEAIHEHDIAVAKLKAAQKDSKLQHSHWDQLKGATERQKTIVEQAIGTQEEHNKAREIKLARIRGASAPSSVLRPTIGLPGQTGPAVDNQGHAVGYGVDFNHTAVDSEGNAVGTTNYSGGPPI